MTLTIIEQNQALVALYEYYGLDLSARTQVVENMISAAEMLYYTLGELTDDLYASIDEMVLESDLPSELLQNKEVVDRFKIIYYNSIFYILNQLSILDLPKGVKYVYAMDNYKIVLEISDINIKEIIYGSKF